MHSFTFNGLNSRTYCKMFVSGGGTFNAPERDVESISVPGRNGTLTIDHGRYENIQVEYPAWIAEDFDMNMAKARVWLCKSPGYKRLEDDYHPNEFRMAKYVSGLEVTPIVSAGDYLGGQMTLRFDCMPQRFLKSGEVQKSLLATDVVVNPTEFVALPLIVVNGDGQGTITVNGNVFRLNNIQNGMIIDSEMQKTYVGTTSLDLYTEGDYPVLQPGVNNIVYATVPGTGSHITSSIITPRWWTL